MKDRIQKLINQEQMTSAKFADSIGVQRSSISHILSGRNKPSLEFVQKVLTTFPGLSSDWLIFGRGKMYSVEEPVSLFSNPILESFENQQPKVVENQNITTNQIQEVVDEPAKESNIFESLPNLGEDKKIERIVIFYTDHTFDVYKPS